MATYTFSVNGKPQSVEAANPDMPLLWVLRDRLGLTGTKYGCGVGICGACTVHLDGRAERSCQVSVSAARRPPRDDDRRPLAGRRASRASGRGSPRTSRSAATASPG